MRIKRLYWVAILVAILTILFANVVIADEMGGFGSEPLIGVVTGSELFLGFANNTLLDVGFTGDSPGVLGSHFYLLYVVAFLLLLLIWEVTKRNNER